MQTIASLNLAENSIRRGQGLAPRTVEQTARDLGLPDAEQATVIEQWRADRYIDAVTASVEVG